MKRTNYEKLAQDVANGIRAHPNHDNDPVTAGQQRGADVSGQLAAFMQREIDQVLNGEQEDGSLPLQVLAAMVAVEVFNDVTSSGQPYLAAALFTQAFATSLTSMLKAYDAAGGKKGL